MRAVAFRPLAFRRPLDRALRPPLGGTMAPLVACGVPAVLILAIGGLTAFAQRDSAAFTALVLLAATLGVYAQARAISSVRLDARREIAEKRRHAADLADSRVEALARQFGWAVEDNVRLSREIRRARAERSTALAGGVAAHREILQLRELVTSAQARLGELAPAEASDLSGAADRVADHVVRLAWGLHDDGMIRWLQLEGGSFDAVPSRVRILTAAGAVVAVTQRSLAARTGTLAAGPRRGLASMVFQVPDAVIDALESGYSAAYRFEAQVEDEWWPVELIDSGCRSSGSRQRVKPVVDKRGRIFGGAEAAG